jgi:hypothetical protein
MQRRKAHDVRRGLEDVQLYAWMPSGKTLYRTRENSSRNGLGAGNPYLTNGWVRERLDVFDPGPEFVKSGLRSLHESGAVHRQLDAARGSIKQWSFDGVLERGDRLRHGRLRHAEMDAGLAHASVLGDREQNMQIAQPDAAPDPAIPIAQFSH